MLFRLYEGNGITKYFIEMMVKRNKKKIYI